LLVPDYSTLCRSCKILTAAISDITSNLHNALPDSSSDDS